MKGVFILYRFFDLLKFRLERFLLGGAHYRLTFIAFLLLLVSLIGGIVIKIVDPELAKLENGVWWAFLRLSDPGYLGDDHGIAKRFIATIITILGYVLFMGALVAIMTQWLHSAIRKLESGFTPISKNGHIVILGWTNRTAAVVREIFSSGTRLKRFLSHLERGGLHVVILAPEIGPELTSALKEELGPYWNPRKITFRSGVPIKIEDLKRVDCLHASVIILPGKALYEDAIESIDAGTIKTLLSLSNLNHQSEKESFPPVVAEIMDTSRAVIAEKSYNGKIEVVSSIAIISRLICQTIRSPGLSQVYSELMTHEVGNAFYLRECPEFANKTWSQISLAFATSIPIGISRNIGKDNKVFLCPDLSATLNSKDEIIFIAKNLEATKGHALIDPSERIKKLKTIPPLQAKEKNIIIFGWSQKIPFILRELNRHQNEKYKITIVSNLDIEQRTKILSARENKLQMIDVEHIIADYTLPKGLADIKVEEFDFVLFLASDRISSLEETDSRTILGYLLFEDRIKNSVRRPSVLIELIDPANEDLIMKRKDDVIISPLIISHLVGSVSLRMELNSLFDELFQSGGVEFKFQKAADIEIKGETTFHLVQQLALSQGRIPIGFRTYSESKQNIILAPERHLPIQLGLDDEIIFLCRDAADGSEE